MEVDERDQLLVVEDDEATRSFLCENLAADGFRVGAAEGVRAIEVRSPSLDGLASRIDPHLPAERARGPAA